jgi:hypothetical protein
MSRLLVISVQAGIPLPLNGLGEDKSGIPAFAGMTGGARLASR